MMHNKAGSIVVATCLVVAAGCTTSPPADKASSGADVLIPCEELRPEICTMHYAPVCGALEDGGTKTYSNACVACSDRGVMGYSEGPCSTDDGGDEPRGR